VKKSDGGRRVMVEEERWWKKSDGGRRVMVEEE
jgi:hypothetical protein